MTLRDGFFLLLGLLSGSAACLAVTARRVVAAGSWLVTALVALAGCYLVLGAEVVALVQVLIYVGAVVILVIFSLMVTRSGAESLDHCPPQRWAAALAGLATTGLLLGTLGEAVRGHRFAVDSLRSQADELAGSLFGTWVLPFELLSLLLLAALIGALLLTRSRP